jgi:hypothetical protein
LPENVKTVAAKIEMMPSIKKIFGRLRSEFKIRQKHLLSRFNETFPTITAALNLATFRRKNKTL